MACFFLGMDWPGCISDGIGCVAAGLLVSGIGVVPGCWASAIPEVAKAPDSRSTIIGVRMTLTSASLPSCRRPADFIWVLPVPSHAGLCTTPQAPFWPQPRAVPVSGAKGGPGCRRPYWVVAGGGVGASAPPNQPKSQASRSRTTTAATAYQMRGSTLSTEVPFDWYIQGEYSARSASVRCRPRPRPGGPGHHRRRRGATPADRGSPPSAGPGEGRTRRQSPCWPWVNHPNRRRSVAWPGRRTRS